MNATSTMRVDDEEPLDPILFMAALDACPESLAILEQGRILYAARAFGQTIGIGDSSHLRGKPLSDFLAAIPKSGEIPEKQVSIISTGTPAPIAARVTNFRVRERELQVLSINPVHPQKNNESALFESQKMESMGRLLAGVAHDFNNVITGILLYCDLLLVGLESGSRLHHHAEAIHKAGANGAVMIQQLLMLSREEAVEMDSLSWNDVIADMKSLLTRLVGHHIELRTELDESLNKVRMDRTQVRQIILNLALNARDAMTTGGTITIITRNRKSAGTSSEKTAGPDSWVEFQIVDTGEGMDDQTMSQLFTPYFTTKKPGQGNGLGLSMVQSIVSQAGGTVGVQSEPQKGTRVTIAVPYAAA